MKFNAKGRAILAASVTFAAAGILSTLAYFKVGDAEEVVNTLTVWLKFFGTNNTIVKETTLPLAATIVVTGIEAGIDKTFRFFRRNKVKPTDLEQPKSPKEMTVQENLEAMWNHLSWALTHSKPGQQAPNGEQRQLELARAHYVEAHHQLGLQQADLQTFFEEISQLIHATASPREDTRKFISDKTIKGFSDRFQKILQAFVGYGSFSPPPLK